MSRVSFILLTSLLVAGACSSWETASDPRPGTDFSAYRTYAWVPWNQQPPPEPGMRNMAIAEWIRSMFDDAIAARGYVRDEAEPDLRVLYRLGVTDGLGKMEWGFGYGAREGTPGFPNTRQASLSVEIRDARTGERVWRGLAGGALDEADREDGLRGVIQRVVSRLPAR
jgi:hypothetical protein